MNFVDHFMNYCLMYTILFILNDSLQPFKNENNNIEGNSIEEFNFKQTFIIRTNFYFFQKMVAVCHFSFQKEKGPTFKIFQSVFNCIGCVFSQRRQQFAVFSKGNRLAEIVLTFLPSMHILQNTTALHFQCIFIIQLSCHLLYVPSPMFSALECHESPKLILLIMQSRHYKSILLIRNGGLEKLSELVKTIVSARDRIQEAPKPYPFCYFFVSQFLILLWKTESCL